MKSDSIQRLLSLLKKNGHGKKFTFLDVLRRLFYVGSAFFLSFALLPPAPKDTSSTSRFWLFLWATWSFVAGAALSPNMQDLQAGLAKGIREFQKASDEVTLEIRQLFGDHNDDDDGDDPPDKK